jgi:hypothetical protein
MRKVLRWCGYVALALVLLVVGGYVIRGLSGAAGVAHAKKRAAAELAAALPASEEQSVRDRDRVRAAVVATWGRPTYAWQELVCSLDTVDAGWIVQSYTQECRIRSVDLIPATGAAGDRCEWTSVPTRVEGEPMSGVTATIGPSSAFDEQHPYRLGCPGGILAPPTGGASRMLSGSRPADLESSPAWIVVTTDTAVSSTDLGCDPWAVVFCSSPVDRPVLGDLAERSG